MGFSLVAEALIAGYLPKGDWTRLFTKLGYSVGFSIVVLGRQQLFTETTLTAVLPVLTGRSWQMAMRMVRLWGVVLLANLVGTYLFALCVARVHIFSPQVQQTLTAVSEDGLGAGFWVVVMRAIFAGWLIALMVWLLPGAESARVSIIIILTYLIGLGGFNHVIAGSTKILFLVATGAESWGFYLGGADAGGEYYWRGFVDGVFGARAGGGGEGRTSFTQRVAMTGSPEKSNTLATNAPRFY
jgi:formate-nitrite transporter family protein